MKNKPATTNDYQQRINRVVEYIRMHLDEDIDLRVLAELAGFSPYHFHRIVSALLGEPLGEFIVRTRIETAARLPALYGCSRRGDRLPRGVRHALVAEQGVPAVFRHLAQSVSNH